MTLAATDRNAAPDVAHDDAPVTPWLVVAGLASLGAGVVHAAAAGAHGDHPAAVWTFALLAVAQVGWGVVALHRRDRPVVYGGLLVGLAAVAGWVVAKTVGLWFIPGLDTVEPVQLADASAAALAAIATVAALAALGRSAVGPQVRSWVFVVAVTAFATSGTVATSRHEHSHAEVPAGAVHPAGAHAHAAVAYDPALPVDLSGTPGVTPRQQAAAEQLVVLTLARLPQWSDPAVAMKAGFRSIGDGFTGTEHFINAAFLTDRTTLDPDRPESLVYDTTGGGRKLVAAMYMLAPGTKLADAPDLGALVQWHIHDNLCFTRSGLVRGITDASGACPAGLVKPLPAPMVHVWITKNPCGPFAALEGIGGGQIAPGSARLCDHLHGTGS